MPLNFGPLKQQLLGRLSRLPLIALWWKEPPPGWPPYDPYARKPAPRLPRPKSRSGAVALAEPDDE
jgi:hypothetical protein